MEVYLFFKMITPQNKLFPLLSIKIKFTPLLQIDVKRLDKLITVSIIRGVFRGVALGAKPSLNPLKSIYFRGFSGQTGAEFLKTPVSIIPIIILQASSLKLLQFPLTSALCSSRASICPLLQYIHLLTSLFYYYLLYSLTHKTLEYEYNLYWNWYLFYVAIKSTSSWKSISKTSVSVNTYNSCCVKCSLDCEKPKLIQK